MLASTRPRPVMAAVVVTLVAALGAAPAAADSVVLEPSPAGSLAAPESPLGDEDGGLSYLEQVAVGAFIIAGVGLTTMAITGGVALGQVDSLGDDCVDDVCPADREGDIDDAKTMADLATAGFALTVLGTVTAVIALVAEAQQDGATDAEDGEERASVELRLGPASLGVSGHF